MAEAIAQPEVSHSETILLMTEDPLDDVVVDVTDMVLPDAEARHLMRRRLHVAPVNHVAELSFEQRFPAPRRLDIGAGFVREPGWIAVDVDPRTSPDLLTDAQSLLVPDDSVDEARMVSSLGCFASPARALRETWRVLRVNSALIITEPYAFSTVSLPHVKNHLSMTFWHHVARDAVTEYVPANTSGRWELASYKRDLHQNMTDQVCRKLKFTVEQAVSLMPGLVKRQTAVLVKIVL
jgi:hypothetical protein